MNFGPRMPEEVRVHPEPGEFKDDSADLLAQHVLRLRAAASSGKQFLIAGCRQDGPVAIAIFFDEIGRLMRQRHIDELTILHLTLLEDEV